MSASLHSSRLPGPGKHQPSGTRFTQIGRSGSGLVNPADLRGQGVNRESAFKGQIAKILN
jgi:hypothetical protein